MRRLPSHLGWIGAGLILLAAGLALGNGVLLAGAIFVLVTALLSTLLSPPHEVRLTRDLESSCWIGDALTVERRLTVRSGIGAILVHDALPPEAQVASGSNMRLAWKWPGLLSEDLSYRVRFPRRGLFALDESGWESRAPLGANSRAGGPAGGRLQVSVVPRIRSIANLNALRAPARSGRISANPAKLGTESDEFRELRRFQPGDPFNRINWKATARARRPDQLPWVNAMYPEGRKGVWIFLDAAEYMDVGTPMSNPMENTIEAAGALAQYYLVQGASLGTYAYNLLGGRGGLLAPDAGRNQFNRLVQMLAGIKPGPAEEDLLQAVERCMGFLRRMNPDVFVITRLDVQFERPGETPGSMSRFRKAIARLASLAGSDARRSRVQVVHVKPLDDAAGEGRLDLAGWEARVVARDVRRSGAHVVEWDPDREEFATVLLRHAASAR